MSIWVQIRGVRCHLPRCWVWGEAGRAGLSSGRSKKNKIHGKQNVKIRSATQQKEKTLVCVNGILCASVDHKMLHRTWRGLQQEVFHDKCLLRAVSSQINVSLVCSLGEERTRHLSLSHVLDQGNHGDHGSDNSTPPPSSSIKNHEPLSDALL